MDVKSLSERERWRVIWKSDGDNVGFQKQRGEERKLERKGSCVYAKREKEGWEREREKKHEREWDNTFVWGN